MSQKSNEHQSFLLQPILYNWTLFCPLRLNANVLEEILFTRGVTNWVSLLSSEGSGGGGGCGGCGGSAGSEGSETVFFFLCTICS